MKYYIIAGEASGDLHGSNLIKGLKRQQPDCQIRCWGGDLMCQAGGELVRHYKDTAIIGFWEVAKSIGKIYRNLQFCKSDILSFNPDLIILIDYPGFNFRIAEFAHKQGFKVFYYIAPKIWAWKEKRGKRLQRYVDKLFIIFPFEINYFKERWNIDAIYRGNPLLDSIESYPYINESKEDFCKRVGLNDSKEFIALVAGSRRGEIAYLLPRMLKVIEHYPDHKFLLAAAPSIPMSYYESIIKKYLKKRGLTPEAEETYRKQLSILYGETYSLMKHSSAAIVNSGTASLEAAIIGVPQVVCYGASELTYIIARALVKGVKYISLANIILDKPIFRELIQHDCTTVNISEEVDRLISDRIYADTMREDYESLRQALGGRGASDAVAGAVIEEYQKLTE